MSEANLAIKPLTGMRVLVTRPKAQAQPLCDVITQAGGQAVCYPCLVIEPADNPEQVRSLLCQPDWDFCIFISVNAVKFAFDLIGQTNAFAGANFAVGKATQKALLQHGVLAGAPADDAQNSEGLLAMEPLSQVSGKKILIVRGAGGKALLGDELARRGAKMTYAEVYRRVMPEQKPLDLAELAQIDVITVTSCELLQNFAALNCQSPKSNWIDKPLIVISQSMIECAQNLGFRQILLAKNPQNASIVQAINCYRKTDQ